jgi:integrase
MILTAYRHGLRNSEVCDLQWHQVELSAGCLHVRTAKNVSTQCRAPAYARCGVSSANRGPSPQIFSSERGGPMTGKSFGTLFMR